MSNVISIDAHYDQQGAETLKANREAIMEFVSDTRMMANHPDECFPVGFKLLANMWEGLGLNPETLVYLSNYSPVLVEIEDSRNVRYDHEYMHGELIDGEYPVISSILLEEGEFEPHPLPGLEAVTLFRDAFDRAPLAKFAPEGDPAFTALAHAEQEYGFAFHGLVSFPDRIEVVLLSPAERMTITVYLKYYHDMYLRARKAAEQDQRINPNAPVIDWSVFEPKP